MKKEKVNRIPWTVVGVAFVALIAVIAVVLAELGIWYSALISICSIVVIVVISIALIGVELKKNVKDVLEAQRIEVEKQAMEMKLQESQISIMLSQIQPHFLYNTLNSIYQLCETNPMRARAMVNYFAEYLRNNLSALDEQGLVSFETELSHVKTYLEIEKIRFEDTLEVEFDIKCDKFSLPVLTVQPIVENAVKHGTSKKRGGGKVVISAYEDDNDYIIIVSDTGAGFDTSVSKNDGKSHVGIENVRQRLSNMCSGSLATESEVGAGTVVTIRIPKSAKK